MDGNAKRSEAGSKYPKESLMKRVKTVLLILALWISVTDSRSR